MVLVQSGRFADDLESMRVREVDRFGPLRVKTCPDHQSRHAIGFVLALLDVVESRFLVGRSSEHAPISFCRIYEPI